MLRKMDNMVRKSRYLDFKNTFDMNNCILMKN